MAKRARNADVCSNCGTRYGLTWVNGISGSRYVLLCQGCRMLIEEAARVSWLKGD